MDGSPGFLLRLNQSASRCRKLKLIKKTTSAYGFLWCFVRRKDCDTIINTQK
jgi:hypothetical protein